MWSSPKHFIVQTSPEGLFRFEGPAFESVQELIIHQVWFHFEHQSNSLIVSFSEYSWEVLSNTIFLQFQSGLPVTSRSGAILKTTVVREKWELNNDDIELVRSTWWLTISIRNHINNRLLIRKYLLNILVSLGW